MTGSPLKYYPNSHSRALRSVDAPKSPIKGIVYTIPLVQWQPCENRKLPGRIRRWRCSLEVLRSHILSTYIRMALAYTGRVASPMLSGLDDQSSAGTTRHTYTVSARIGAMVVRVALRHKCAGHEGDRVGPYRGVGP